MLSTLSSFLPPVLQLGSQDKNSSSRLPDNDPETDNQEHDRSHRPSTNGFTNDMSVDEHGVKKRKERTHESFIVVRPPPAKSNHPLNLQVQLVPPNARDNRTTPSRRSIDSTAESTTEDGHNILSRTSSSRSDTSVYSSGYSSVTSFSTVASTSSSTSTRRMIIPLYNLQAHNVLTNVIVDAGTDAKIAKFQKRGLEIIGLAMLEPVEVWAGASFDSTAPRQSEYVSSHQQQQQQQQSLALDHSLQTPTSSALSLTSDSHSYPETLPPNPSTPTAQQEGRGSARKFIGKIFRRKGGDNPSSASPSYNSTSQPSSPFTSESTPRSIKRSSLLAAAASTLTQRMPSSPATANFLPITPTRSQNPSEGGGRGGEGGSGEGYASATTTVLGIQPILNSPVIPPKGKHPKMYVWVVRRWLKGGSLDGIFSGLSNLPGSSSAGGVGLVEVRFEWTRSKGKKKERKEGQRERKESLGIPSNTPSTSSLSQPLPPPSTAAAVSSLAKSKAERSAPTKSKSREGRMSKERGSGRRSVSPNPPGSVNTHTTNSTDETPNSPSRHSRRVDDEDAGEESDPEDSETPWTCTLTLRPRNSSYSSRSSHSTSGTAGPYPQHLSSPLPSTTSSSGQQPQPSPQHEVRVKVGAVVPTPHHPKVVSLLKIPFPLPDIEVDKVIVRKRVVTPAGVARPVLSPVESSTAGSEGEYGGFAMAQSRVGGSSSKSVPMSPFGSTFGSGKGSSGGGMGSTGGGGTGIVLTAEEIKDVVCCTGLWLVVREGFGGVGKEKRKGDGWRIRG